jgi:hypothetical protein
VEERGGGDVEGVGSRASAGAVIGGASGGVSLEREIGRKEIKICPV